VLTRLPPWEGPPSPATASRLKIYNKIVVPDFSEILSILLSNNIRLSGKKSAAVTCNTPAFRTYLNKSIQIYFRKQPDQWDKNDFKKEKPGFF